MTFPLPYTLKVRAATTGTADGFGNHPTTWAERDWPVHAYVEGAATTDQAGDNRADLSVIAYTVYAPATDPPGEYDEVRVAGRWYPVDGRPKDYSHGPWVAPFAGVVVELRRVDG